MTPSTALGDNGGAVVVDESEPGDEEQEDGGEMVGGCLHRRLRGDKCEKELMLAMYVTCVSLCLSLPLARAWVYVSVYLWLSR